MSGQNIDLLGMEPGLCRNTTQYACGRRWYDGNQVRWQDGILEPIGGWRTVHTFTGPTTPIRDMFSWRDDLKAPWLAAGASDKLICASFNQDTGAFTQYDATPLALGWNPGGLVGYGRGTYGSGYYGLDAVSVALDTTGVWSFDNFGKLLVAVHSQDGRLFSWDPLTPSTIAAVVTGAPTDNTLVITTEEEHLMVLGGINNPRKVEWSSRREINTWTPAADNSAGGFDLKTNGAIITAVKVQSGILVICDTDIHLIEYVGPPNYYGRRKISDQGGIVGKNAIASIQGDAVWMDHSNLFSFAGGAITKVPCTLQVDLFHNSNLQQPELVFAGMNEWSQEVWFFHPIAGGNDPNRYVSLTYGDAPYWSKGEITRTAWCAPVWQPRPLACNNLTLYEHEFEHLADGESRNDEIYVETGAFELSTENDPDGGTLTRVDRLYQDVLVAPHNEDESTDDPDAFMLTFKLRQAPHAPERLVGPIAMANPKGYTTVRFRTRQLVVRLTQNKDVHWKLGKVRARIKPGGRR